MLLLHQTGSVKVGEVVRYTLTYTPGLDRILPPPTHLHVKIKNTSAVPLRAAYLHGPYTVYVACYPSTYDPSKNHTHTAAVEGAPDFEPQLKAGGHWHSKLVVPEEVREDADQSFFNTSQPRERKSFTWIIEVASQVLFSTTASVHFEVLVGRDTKSIELGFHGVVGSGQGAPGKLEDHQQGRDRNAAQVKGVFSKAIRLAVDDTESLWNTPAFPRKDDKDQTITLEQPPQHGDKRDAGAKPEKKTKKQKKIHLVCLTHGLHSNLGADMLYMKESIDTAARQAKENARRRKANKAAAASAGGRGRNDERAASAPEIILAPTEKHSAEEEEEESDDEEVLVRGFNGNAVKTEKGIQYLGKRFAKYVLLITYPNQPYLPVKSSISKSITRSLTGSNSKAIDKNKARPGVVKADDQKPIHKNSTIMRDEKHTSHKDDLPYKITSISFIGHSLGGLVQTYAIAYIQKHSPDFFDLIKPVNFVALATPFLGLSNENPMYVKFALDFGLVGRTGQDLGLSWKAPQFAKHSWTTVMNGLGVDTRKDKQEPDPASKPLLRILPTGPAHVALRKFRHRTVYANVVNDGIVPLRTSCLLFLDWRGLGRVEKARRDNGLVGTMLEWGWTEMLGQNASAPRKHFTDFFNDDDSESTKTQIAKPDASPDPGSSVPQADASQELDDTGASEPDRNQFLDSKPLHEEVHRSQSNETKQNSVEQASNMWTGFLALFRPQAGKQKSEPKNPPKSQRIYRRGQTMMQSGTDDASSQNDSGTENPRKALVRGPSLYSAKSGDDTLQAPPKTTVFESAGDLLHPPLPPKEFILDPAARPRTIFHDRIYHPDDIPAPPVKKGRSFLKRASSRESEISNSGSNSLQSARPPSQHSDMSEIGSMRIEEKIARAYHKDLTWRKVLVRLEPDAHNNMIVRRMFANAYGWPVVQHLCDTHFGYTATAYTRDEDIDNEERAKPLEAAVHARGEQVHGQRDPPEDEVNRPRSKSKGQPQKAATMNDMDGLPQTPDKVAKIHDSLSPSIQDQDNTRVSSSPVTTTASPNRTARTQSEAREARDQVSDLVSRVTATGELSTESSGSSHTTFSNLNSSSNSRLALKQQLAARRDSGRWSDRFFEDDEDEDDDDANELYLQELRRAKERGEYLTTEELQIIKTRDSINSRGAQQGDDGADKTDPGQPLVTKTVTAEPDELDPEEPSAIDGGQGGDPVDDQTLALTGVAVGLQKSVEEQVGGPESPTQVIAPASPAKGTST